MLHELVGYARACGIDAESGFTPKTVRWLVVLSASGKFLHVLDQADPNDRRSRGRTIRKAPHLKFSGDTPMRQFLIDTAQYALLYGVAERDEKLRAKHEFFLNLLKEAGDVDRRFRTVAEAIADEATRQRICQALSSQPRPAKAADNVTFAVIEDGEPCILAEQDHWHDWWRGHFPGLFGQRDEPPDPVPCLITGVVTEPARTHPKIKGLGGVGGKVETTLVSFNEAAFCSYGLEQSRNAAVSNEAAEQYAAALNDLIEHRSVNLAGAKVVYWYVGKGPAPEIDPLDMILSGEDFGEAEVIESPPVIRTPTHRERAQALGRARNLLEAARTGKRPDLAGYRYCALTLSGNSARVVVRDWMEGQFAELLSNVTAWFNDLSIVARDGGGLARRPKFAAVLAATARELGDIPAPLVGVLWHVAVRSAVIPHDIAARTLTRVTLDVVTDKPALHGRLGLLKAFCIRNGDLHMQPYLNENHPEPAYHCGRLLAVLAYIQWKALGDVGAGVVQRYYAAASATPALVLGRLARTAQFHLDKIADTRVRRGLDNRLADIWGRMKDGVPTTLTLEQQTLFALGYYHQKAYRGPEAEAAAGAQPMFVVSA